MNLIVIGVSYYFFLILFLNNTKSQTIYNEFINATDIAIRRQNVQDITNSISMNDDSQENYRRHNNNDHHKHEHNRHRRRRRRRPRQREIDRLRTFNCVRLQMKRPGDQIFYEGVYDNYQVYHIGQSNPINITIVNNNQNDNKQIRYPQNFPPGTYIKAPVNLTLDEKHVIIEHIENNRTIKVEQSPEHVNIETFFGNLNKLLFIDKPLVGNFSIRTINLLKILFPSVDRYPTVKQIIFSNRSIFISLIRLIRHIRQIIVTNSYSGPPAKVIMSTVSQIFWSTVNFYFNKHIWIQMELRFPIIYRTIRKHVHAYLNNPSKLISFAQIPIGIISALIQRFKHSSSSIIAHCVQLVIKLIRYCFKLIASPTQIISQTFHIILRAILPTSIYRLIAWMPGQQLTGTHLPPGTYVMRTYIESYQPATIFSYFGTIGRSINQLIATTIGQSMKGNHITSTLYLPVIQLPFGTCKITYINKS